MKGVLKKSSGCCSSGSSCCSNENEIVDDRRHIVIDFLYLDVTICERCQGTDKNLDEALIEVSNILKATGVDVIVNKINVNTEDLAIKHKFLTSPTIRINGADIQMEYKESLCESCGDLCGDEVDCRVWIYQGKEYNEPPKAMIIESILKAVYGGSIKQEEDNYKLPENLKKFYESIKRK